MERRLFFEWVFLVTFWVTYSVWYTAAILTALYFLVDFFGLHAQIASDPFLRYSFSNFQYLESILFGLFFGTLFFAINRMSENPKLNKKSTARIIMIKSFHYIFSLLFVYILVTVVLNLTSVMPQGYVKWGFTLLEDFEITYTIPVLIWLIMGILLTNFLLQVNKKYGEGNIWPIFLGKYRTPVSEKRVFMFIDLKSSTFYAEKLGHLKYSRLIQDCFFEINNLVYAHQAEIYQYVGDEMVLTWNETSAFHKLNCVNIYFAFDHIIQQKAAYFEDEYGFVPEFKVGLNSGEVTTAEIGIIKRDIGYYGDTINTAARIQDLCNEYNKNFLTSEAIINQCPHWNGYTNDYLGEVKIKGRKEPVKIFSIEEDGRVAS